MGELQTKRVRAFNVRVGDEVSFLDYTWQMERSALVRVRRATP